MPNRRAASQRAQLLIENRPPYRRIELHIVIISRPLLLLTGS